MSNVSILGYNTQANSSARCTQEISIALQNNERDCVWMACLNPHSYAVARRDTSFRTALHSASWLVPDGTGILIAARLLGRPIFERITGFDIFEGVMGELNRTGGSVFFLGSTKQTLRLISEKLPRDYPNVRLAGIYSPPFKQEFSEAENEAMVNAVASSNADVLWVGMTAPKQEKWIAENSNRLNVNFAGAIGAVFDFYVGRIRRSHPIFRRVGLEWLPRLLQEPRRLWRRTFVSAPIFMVDVFRAIITVGRN